MRAVVFDLDATLAVVERDRATLLAEATEAADAPALSRAAYRRAHRRDHAHDTREPIFAALLDGADGPAGGGARAGRADGDDEADGDDGADEAGGADEGTESGRPAAVEDAAGTDPAAVAAAYRRAIADALRPVPGVESMLADLRERYRVGLLTNGPSTAQREKLAVLGWEDAFDATVVTGELGAGKPDERAFRAVLDALGASAEEAVHVGDQVEADVEGARDAGLVAVQVLHDGGPTPSPRADAHVRRDELVAALPGVLDGLCE